MLVEFTIQNFRSIREALTVSMLPSAKVKERFYPLHKTEYKDLSLLQAVVFYGKNNAGKSNILKAFSAFKWLVDNSNDLSINEKIQANKYFLFNKESINQPTYFEVDFIGENKIRYVYKVVFDNTIIEESASFYKLHLDRQQPTKLFERKKGKPIDFGEEHKGAKKSLEKDLGSNQLFLSKAAINNPNEHLAAIYSFFQNIEFVSFDSNYEEHIFNRKAIGIASTKSEYTERIGSLLHSFDTGILSIDIKINTEEQFKFPDNISNEVKKKIIEDLKHSVRTEHRFFDVMNELESIFTPLELESLGTQKLFSLLAVVLDAIDNKKLLIIDELDKSLHTYWTNHIIKLLYEELDSQLLFATHDSNLIDMPIFERDQIYTVDKNYYGETEILSLADFTGIKKNDSLEKMYLAGKFGSIPSIK